MATIVLGNILSYIGLLRPLLINSGERTAKLHRSQLCFVLSIDRIVDVLLGGLILGLTAVLCAPEEFNAVPLGLSVVWTTTAYFFNLVRCAINSIADPMSPPNVSHITSVYVAPRLGTKLW